MTALDPFEGFGPEAMSFLDGLAAENTRAYFEAHRALYEAQVVVPLKSLVVAVGDRLADVVDHELSYEPRVGRSLFRIHRDLRFSADKTPYQTHLDAIWWTGEAPKTSAAFIARLTPAQTLTGAGMFGLTGERLQRYRAAVAGDPGVELARSVARLRDELGAQCSEPSRKRVPQGYPSDHPRADLLVRDGFHVRLVEPTPALVGRPEFAVWLAGRLERFADVQRWFVHHV